MHHLPDLPQVTVWWLDLDFAETEFSFGAQPLEATISQTRTPDVLEGRQVFADGYLKGYRGIIKSTNRIRGTAQVELEAGQRIRSFYFSELYDSK